jgi:hypothetical protein
MADTSRAYGLDNQFLATVDGLYIVSAMDVLMLLTAYAGQCLGNAVLGSYASGFGGGLNVDHLRVGDLASPGHTADRLVGIAGLLAAVHRHADIGDVNRRRRADLAVAVAAGRPAHQVAGSEGLP